jgi:hypothetical protein
MPAPESIASWRAVLDRHRGQQTGARLGRELVDVLRPRRVLRALAHQPPLGIVDEDGFHSRGVAAAAHHAGARVDRQVARLSMSQREVPSMEN